MQGVDLDKAAETHRHESQETPYGASETDPFSATAPVEPDHGGHEHEDAGGSALAHAHADADEEDLFAEHQGMPTVIRAAKDDFRGFLGDLERAVKPYQDASAPHHHTAGTELLPWYRLMALADPHNVRAYVVASMWLSQAGKWDEAEAFLLEGIQANPDNPERFRLHVALATLYVKSRHEAVWGGRDWAALALAQAQAAWRQAAAERPGGGRIGEARGGLVWLETHEEDFLFAGRYRILLLRQAGRLGEALAASEELQRLAPDDEPNRRTLDELRKQAATP